ncbi:MAG: AmmeMemoRadiSam system protein B [Patescibacteria group bacterium]
MPIVAAAVLPHTPLLLPTVAKEHAALLAVTTSQVQAVAADCYAAKPDVLVILTPHGSTLRQAIVVHAAEVYRGGFADFGDLVTHLDARGALGLTHQLKMAAEREHLPLVLQTFPELDYGTSIPLIFLLKSQPQAPVIPIIVPPRQPDLLLRTGAVLHDFLSATRARSVIVASADLSRRRERIPDARRRPSGEERRLSSAIVAVDPAQAAAVTPRLSTCGYDPIVVLLSTLQGLASSGRVMSFEAPFGVGLMTATFDLQP